MASDAVDVIREQWQQVRPSLDTEAMGVAGRLYRAADALGLLVEQAYAVHGVNRGEFDVLATLRRSGEPYTLAPRELSTALMITSGGMTGRLDRLERAGLIERLPDPTDRRALRIRLTRKGRSLVDRAVESGLTVQRRVLAEALEPKQIALLDELLRSVMNAAEAMR